MYGYHELNNTVKHLICRQPTDNCIYAKNAHFSWEHYDPTDVYDFDIREYRKSLRLVTGATADAML